jgi:methyltransferase family protein
MGGFLSGAVDFAFIDGDHSLASVMSDSLMLLDYMAENGRAVYHDVKYRPGVAMGLELLLADGCYYMGKEKRGLSARADVYDIWPNRQDGLAVVDIKRSIYPFRL